MGRDLFLVVLALLTAVSGVALFVMALRRRRLGTDAAKRNIAHDADAAGAVDEARETVDDERRLIDDYAIPVSFDGAREESEEEPDISKICPRCGRRYGSHHRICERDNIELAALN